MRNMKLQSLTVLLAVVISTAGCDEMSNLTDVNENPNAPTALAPTFVLPSLIRGLASELVGENNIDLPSASLFVQHNARIQYAGTDRYDLGTDYGSSYWGSYYSLSGDPPNGVFVLSQHLLTSALALDPADPNKVAVARILRAYAAHNLSDMYGSIPYTDAVKGAAETPNIRPKYDTQASVYDNLFSELAAATSSITSGAGYTSGDLVFSGDMAKWKAFGNSLRLRLAMRLSDVNASKAQSEAAAAVAAGVMTSTAQSAALNYSTAAPDQNPMWVGFVERPGDYRPGKFFVDEMKRRDDPRVRFHADLTADYQSSKSSEKWRGMPNGYADDRAFDEETPPSRDFDYVSQVGSWHLNPGAPAFFMEYAEVALLQAEAAERGWISGSAQTFYEAGIDASIDVYASGCAVSCGAFVTPAVAAITAAERTTYKTHALVKYGGGGEGGTETNLSLIQRQYWFQLWDQGLEAFNKYRRTNVPVLTPGPDAMNNCVPLRWPYPRSERTFNQSNVESTIAATGGDNAWDKRLWWDASGQATGVATSTSSGVKTGGSACAL
jgi:hypothetical protein